MVAYTSLVQLKSLQVRSSKSHKGENGRVLIVAGSQQYHGASIFSALTSSYFVDLVYVLTEKSNIPFAKNSSPEFIVSELTKKNLEKFAEKADSVLLGPGLSLNSKNKSLINGFLKTFSNKKTILDATALRLLNPKLLHVNCILTPHAQEFQFLFKLNPTSKNAIFCAKKFQCTIVLKQSIETITNGSKTFLDQQGNAGLTTGGTGDILAGLITAFASKNELLLSCCSACFLLGKTADHLAQKKGLNYTAVQVMEQLPETLKSIKNQ
ncbi:MAG: NAD(P)H-hydrate dehydratase [Candidatus Diapherotrites archaeon]|nr:NAD(P)H-hydrate dehydratase [Candidatus Diapherotrites archaeon]